MGDSLAPCSISAFSIPLLDLFFRLKLCICSRNIKLSKNFIKMASEQNLKSLLISKSNEDAIPGSSKEEPIKILETKGMTGSTMKKTKITEDFTDKERIRMEEEGLSEKDFQKIPVSDDDCADFESITPHNESCWADKDLVKLEDLGNWTENLSPRSDEEPNVEPKPNVEAKVKAKRPMKRKRRKGQETAKKIKTD